MASVKDVAGYILQRIGPISAMKLQKLVYYCQAWSLVWDEAPLFESRFEAWANGPVCPELYEQHRGIFIVSQEYLRAGNTAELSEVQRETIDTVLEYLGEKSAQWLSDLTHSEAPWIDARAGCAPTDRSNAEITLAAMHEYYSGLQRQTN